MRILSKQTSNKKFGIFFSLIFLCLSLFYYYRNTLTLLLISLTLSITLLILVVKMPNMLTTPNLVWHKFGNFLGRILNPLTLAAVYFLVFTPLGIFLRLLGRDELGLNSSKRTTYWNIRSNPNFKPETFLRQF